MSCHATYVTIVNIKVMAYTELAFPNQVNFYDALQF